MSDHTVAVPASRPVPPAQSLLNIVIPCYNEEEALPETAGQLSALLDRMAAEGLIAPDSGIYFVDDGSADRTWDLIEQLSAQRPARFHGIKLTRNCGHQNALLAGLHHAPGDMLVTIDADLQDEPETIVAMVRRYHEGCEIVFGVRNARDADTLLYRPTVQFFYSLMKWLGADIIPHHADFRLMSRRALDSLARYREANLFLRGIVPLLGFKTAKEYYARRPRLQGEPKYSFSKLMGLSINGITSFSMRPLRMITMLGFVVSLAAFMVGFWAIWVRLRNPDMVPGWASIVVPMSLIGGLQLLALGMIGEYVGKIYLEVKHRPLFEIERQI